jgi:hypothetical protein
VSPIAQADGHDAPRLIAQPVPGLAAQIDDLVVGLEDAVGEPVVAHELPEVLDGVQFRRLWRQRQDGDVAGQMKFGGGMPAGLIDDEDGMGAGIDRAGDLLEMGVDRLGIAPGQNQPDGLALGRTDGAEDIGPLGALIVRRAGPCSALRPAARDLVLLPDPGFILEPQFDLYARFETRADRFDLGWEVFLKASTANSFCAW